jgi:hypothetical protein
LSKTATGKVLKKELRAKFGSVAGTLTREL